MSFAANRKTKPIRARRERDLFRYGVRLVRGKLPDGTTGYVPTPMPQEALLHPRNEDYPLETDAHDDDCGYLKNVLRVRARRGWVVLSNCRVDWGVPGLKPHGPDISAFKGLRGPKKDWKTFYVAQEKVRPLLTIEVTSPGTRKYDVGIKFDHYHRAEVPLYVIVDARTKQGVRNIEIRGYRRGPTRYEPLELDAQGRLLLDPFGVLLGVENERVCCYDAETGEKIGDYEAVVRAREEAERQAQAAERQAQAELEARLAAEERVRQLEAEMRQLRGET